MSGHGAIVCCGHTVVPGAALQTHLYMRLCETEPPCEYRSVELMFAQWFEKVLAVCLVCGQSQDIPLAADLKIIFLYFVSECF